jgi:F-type H+-transporting ATPase subunit a
LEVIFRPELSEAIVVQWGIILLVLIASILLTRNLKKVPSKKQSSLEILIEFINNIVEETMGPGTKSFVPYIGTLGIFLLLMNLAGLVGVEPPTKEFSVGLALAAITFLVIQGYAIKKHGIKGYFKGYAQPLPLLLPINILERIMLPISLSLRLFGNILAGVIILELVYEGLHEHLFGLTQIGLPIPVHMYFDIFDGTIQMIIFVMLTMINIKVVAEH